MTWRSPTVWCALIVLAISAPAFGQSPGGAADQAEEPSPEMEEAVQGMLPVTDYAGDFRVRPAITGDWGGTRQEWAAKGISFEVDWYQVAQGVVSGGLSSRWEYVTNLDYWLKLDLMRMDLIPGAVIGVRGQSRFGNTVNGITGQLLPVNSYSYFPFTDELDEDVPIAITELYWLQFLSEQVGVQLGKITMFGSPNELAGGEGRTQFMNFQFIYSAVFAQVAPYSALTAAFIWLPTPDVNFTTLVAPLVDASTVSGFGQIGEGAIWATDLDLRYKLGDLDGGTSILFAYAWDNEFARIGGINIDPEDGISLDTIDSSWALTLTAWQYVYKEVEGGELDPFNGRQDLEGVGLFAHLGFGDKNANPVSWSIAAGVTGRGSIPGRDDDTWGIGYFYNDLKDPRTIALGRLEPSVNGLEAYYNIAIAGWGELTLDFQWVDSALPSIDDSYILGLRLLMTF